MVKLFLADNKPLPPRSPYLCNALLGFTGYIARFYAIPKIPTIVFSLLSFFGVAFGYLWGVIFMGDKPTMKALIGGGLIAGSTAILRYFGSV